MIQIKRRNVYSETYTYVTDADVPIDITGYKITFMVKRETDKSMNDDIAVINKQVVIADGTSGQFTISLDSTDTDISPATYDYEVQISKDGKILTVEQDKLHIIKTIIKVAQ